VANSEREENVLEALSLERDFPLLFEDGGFGFGPKKDPAPGQPSLNAKCRTRRRV